MLGARRGLLVGQLVMLLVTLLFLGCCWLAPGWARAARKSIEGVVNINAASVSELQLLPGIGPAKAELIVAYRRQRPFRTVEELARVKGIGPRTVKRLRPHLIVRGESSASAPAAVPRAALPGSSPAAPAPAPAPATGASRAAAAVPNLAGPAPPPAPASASSDASFRCPANHCPAGLWPAAR